MTAPTDLYKVLQVDPEAEVEVVRAAYVALAKKYHPDSGVGTARMMARLNEAWEILGDSERRAAYDRSMAAWAPRPVAPSGSVWSAAGAPGTGVSSPRRTGPTATGSRIEFGRYAGWTIDAIWRQDPDYLEWLARAPAGRRYRTEIYALLAARETPAQTSTGRGGSGVAQRRAGGGSTWFPPWRTRAAGG